MITPGSDAPPWLSIIIPALDEASILEAVLPRLLPHRSAGPGPAVPAVPDGPGFTEVIVVDGGSTDGTAEAARRLGASVIRSPLGRGMQLDAGARAAAGDALLFLHADSTPPAGFAGDIRSTLADPRVLLGAFRLGFAAEGARFRLLERATDLRITLTRTPYGDQGIFCRRSDYFRCGGFPPWPLLEDVAFVRRLRRLRPEAGSAGSAGSRARGRVDILPGRMFTSARRYQSRGFLPALVRNRTASLLWALHAPPGFILAVIGVRGGAPGRRTGA